MMTVKLFMKSGNVIEIKGYDFTITRIGNEIQNLVWELEKGVSEKDIDVCLNYIDVTQIESMVTVFD